MRNESAKPQEMHATVTGSAQPDEEPTSVRTGPASTTGADDLAPAGRVARDDDLAHDTGESEVIDPDAVIIEETVVTSSAPADPPQEPERAAAGTDATSDPARADAMDTTPAATRAGAAEGTTPPPPGTATPADRAGVATGAGAAAAPDGAGPASDAAHLHDRWTAIQSTFVDDPRASVAAAAELVTEAIETLVSAAREREQGLRSEWDRDGVDTEDLRNTLRNYRGFLDHLATL